VAALTRSAPLVEPWSTPCRRRVCERLVRRRVLASCTCIAAMLAAEAGALGTEFQVDARTAVQSYEVTGPWTGAVLDRRRFLQTLGLSAFDLQGERRVGGPSYSVVLLLRLDADFGVNDRLPSDQAGGETSYSAPSAAGARYVPGLRAAPLDLVYGYLEGRNLAGGWLGFRVGRQYVSDVLGWWSFDGGLLRVTTPSHVRAEVYGGLEQRGGLPLSTARYEAQGVWRGSHTDFGVNGDAPRLTDYPSYQYATPAPAFGVALESVGLSWMHARVDYRRVYDSGVSITQQFPDAGGGYRAIDGLRTSSEKIGASADAAITSHAHARAGIAWDLYASRTASAYASLEGYAGRRLTVGADLDYFAPTFDADSIWNWFTHSGIVTATGRATMRVTQSVDASVSAGARRFLTEGDPASFGAAECQAAAREGRAASADCIGRSTFDPSTGAVRDATRDETNRALAATTDALANAAVRYAWPSGLVSVRGSLQTGERGRRVGGDAVGEKRLVGGRYSLGARTSLYDWADPERPDRSATSFGYVLGLGFRPASSACFRLEWEHDMNHLVGQRFRVVGLVDVWVGR
jgi:hypothetical protein